MLTTPNTIETYKEALKDIHDLAFDFDGMTTIDGLKSLVEVMQGVANCALTGKDWFELVQ